MVFDILIQHAEMVELVYTTDLNSVGPYGPCGFESRSRYYIYFNQVGVYDGLVSSIWWKLVKLYVGWYSL